MSALNHPFILSDTTSMRRVRLIRATQFTAAFGLFCVAGVISYNLFVPSLVVIDRITAAEYYEDMLPTFVDEDSATTGGDDSSSAGNVNLLSQLLMLEAEAPTAARRRGLADEAFRASTMIAPSLRNEDVVEKAVNAADADGRQRQKSSLSSANDSKDHLGADTQRMQRATLRPPSTEREVFRIGEANVTFIDLPRAVGSCPEGTKIIMFVVTAPRNARRREVLRRSWMGSVESKEALRRSDIMAVFISGSPEFNETVNAELMESLRNESLHHGDIIVSDFPDSYRKLTYKVLSAYAWARQYCPSAEYLAKVDDDVFVNVYRVSDFIAKRDRLRFETVRARRGGTTGKPWMNIMGPLNNGRTVLHDPASKWYISPEVYPGDTYPRYAAGFFYIVTSSFADAALKATEGRSDLFPVDDAYLTGILAESLGARRTFVEMQARGNWTFGIGSDALLHWLQTDDASPEASIRAAPLAVATNSEIAFEAVNKKMKLVALVRQLRTNDDRQRAHTWTGGSR